MKKEPKISSADDRPRSPEAVQKIPPAGTKTGRTVVGGIWPKLLSASIRTKGVITIPQQVRDQLQLDEGDQVIVTVRDGSIVLTPASVVPRDQTWFWTPQWQEKEAEADAEIAAGAGTLYLNDDDFLDSLDSD